MPSESSSPSRPRLPWALLALLGALAAWGLGFLWRTSFVLDGKRVFCLFDDAMISMAYARNLVEGHGLNWARQGAPVEGFSHPLWTFLMVPFHASGLPLALRSLPLQLLSLALLLVHVALVHRLVVRHFSFGDADRAGTVGSGLPAAVLTAFYYPLCYWALMGMETGLQALLMTASVLLALDIVENGRDRHLPLLLVGLAAYLLRMDMLLMVGVVQLFVWISLRGRRIEPAERRHWLLGAGLFAAAALGYSAFRWFYFHDVLPNTYYLKLTGIRLDVRLLRGASCLADSLLSHLGVLLPVAFGTAYVLVRGERTERRRWVLPAALFLLSAAYSAWVGGDAWEKAEGVRANRFLAFAFPQVFVLGNGLWNLAARDFRPLRRLGPLAGRGLLVVVTLAVLLAADGLGPSERAAERWQDLALARPPLLVVSHQIVLFDVRRLQRIARPDAVVATVWAGIPAYFSDWKMVDLVGYNDRVIAREPSSVPLDRGSYRLYWPGHVKWDYDYVLEERRPDAFLQLWGLLPGVDRRLLRPLGYRRRDGFWVLLGSDRIHYDAPAPG